jgi:hypothetical protein
MLNDCYLYIQVAGLEWNRRRKPGVSMFSLAENVLILSLLEKKEAVRVPSSVCLPFALAGATIIDLVMAGQVQLQNGILILSAAEQQNEPEYIQIARSRMVKAGKARRLDFWVYQIGRKGNHFTRAVLLSLISKGVLGEEKNIFHWPCADNQGQAPGEIKYQLKRGIRDAIFCKASPDDQVLVITALLDCCSMLEHLFTPDEIIAVRRKLKHLIKDANSRQYAELRMLTVAAVDYAVAAASSV